MSMDWFKGKFTGTLHISWENLWFPGDFPLNQSIEYMLILVGGIPTPVKHMKVSWDYYAQYMEKKTCSKPPTSI